MHNNAGTREKRKTMSAAAAAAADDSAASSSSSSSGTTAAASTAAAHSSPSWEARRACYRLLLADAVLAHLCAVVFDAAAADDQAAAPVLFYRCHNDDFALVLHSELAQRVREREAGARNDADAGAGASPPPATRALPLFVRLDGNGNSNKRKRDAAAASARVENGIQYTSAHSDALPPRGQLVFPDSYFGAVVLVAPLESEHPQDHARLFSEMHRVLRPGGCIFLADRLLENHVAPMTGVPSLDHVRRLLTSPRFHVDTLMLHDPDADSGHFLLIATKVES